MPIRSRLRAFVVHRRTRVYTLWLVGLVALYALLGFLVLPWYAKPRIEQALADALQRPVSIERLYANPFALSARVRGLRVHAPDRGGEVAGIDEVYANLAFTSLFRLAPVVDRLRIERPFLNLVRHKDRRYNFQDVIDRYVWQEKAPEPDAEPLRYSLNNIEIIDGRIAFDDRLEGKRHEIRELRIGIPFLSSLPYETDILVQPALSALINGTPLAVRGETTPFAESRETTLYIDLDGLELPQYFDYVPIPLRFQLVAGVLDADLALRLVMRDGKPVTLALAGTAALRNLDLRQRDDERMLGLESLTVELRELDLIGNRLALGSVRLDAPQVHLTRFRGGNLNLGLLLPLENPNAKPAPQKSGEPQPLRYAVESLHIAKGRVQVLDYAAPQTFRTTLSDIAVEAARLGNAGNGKGTYRAQLRVDGKGRLRTQGELALAPLDASGAFTLADLQLPRFQPYIGAERRLAAGALSGEGRYRVQLETGKPASVVVEGLNATLRDTRIHTAVGEDRWRAGRIEVRGGRVDVSKRELHIEEVKGEDVAATVLRTPEGDWHVTGLLRLAAKTSAEETQGEETPPEAPWNYHVARLGLAQSSLHYEDRTAAQPVSLRASGIRLELNGLSNAADAKPELALEATIEKAGRLSLRGPLALAPFGFDWRLNASAIPLLPLEPYWADQVALDVTRGAVNARGRLRLAENRTGRSVLRFGGRVEVQDFAAREGEERRDLMRWKSLVLQETVLRSEPVLVRVGAAALNDFYMRLVLTPEGKLNLQQVFGPPARESETPPAAETPPAPRGKPRIEIGEVRLTGGELDFSDQYIKPNYRAQIGALQGSIGRLLPEEAGRIELRGEIDGVAPVTVSGLVNPLGRSLFLDVEAAAKGVNLPPLSPYSVRYIGYPIERGKLSMDVSYRIEDGNLTAQNQLVLNQLVFGEKVESPEALNVPVHLAVSLLKDGNGVINLDVPISGSLNDPQFSLGSVIARAIGNLFIKIVTSPFAALGAMFGGDGERLGYLEFAAGSAELNEEAIRKLNRIARALRNRPALTLDIAGRVDPEVEADALRRESLMRRLRMLKREDLARELDNSPTLDEVEIAPEEYGDYLKRVYDATDMDKPRNFLGFARRLPAEEMEKLLLAHTAVNEAAMRRLANRRAEAALKWLRTEGQVPPERVYVVAPKLNADDVKNRDAATTRVEFALRR